MLENAAVILQLPGTVGHDKLPAAVQDKIRREALARISTLEDGLCPPVIEGLDQGSLVALRRIAL